MSVPSASHKVFSILLLTAIGVGFIPVHAGAPAQPAAVVPLDSPAPASLAPTPMRSITPADPAAKIHLIEAPQANHTGDAQLSFPLELPPGRLGMQPDLSIQYDSSAANGWLGLGWDLPLPAITVDTRWGVPRYLADKESETYLLDGQQLTPLAHRDEFQERPAGQAEKIFHVRIEGVFQRIIRYGSDPASFWWKVIDKDGTAYYYGGGPDRGGPVIDAVLTDNPGNNQGNIFFWALREVRDTHGNKIQYRYARDIDSGMPLGPLSCSGQPPDLRCGHDLYPESITYTGHDDTEGPYRVEFIRDRNVRPDVIISARGGFKQVTADRLVGVRITYADQLVRTYGLEYGEGAFHKSLLQSIVQYGSQGDEFYRHEFAYYDEVSSGSNAYNGFEAATQWDTGGQGPTVPLLSDIHPVSALGGAQTTDVNGHIYVGFNPGSPTKQGSGGGKVGYSYTRSNGLLELVDVNGDNLPDKVFQWGGGYYYQPNQSGPHGGGSFGTIPLPLRYLPAISTEDTHAFSFGAEQYFVGNALVNTAHAFASESAYLADVNSDGLIDVVDDGSVLFNHLGASGSISYTHTSQDTPVPIGAGASVEITDIISDFQHVQQQFLDNNPPQDTLRRWIAPYAGRIQISGTVALTDTLPECRDNDTADGVRVAIQHNDRELWSTSIPADDLAPILPDLDSLPVRMHDRIYFRVGPVADGNCDQVVWDPEIVYLGEPATIDANLLDPFRYSASGDFVLAGRRDLQLSMPFTGTVQLGGRLDKLGTTTDDITALVLKNGAPVHSEGMAWDETGTISPTTSVAVVRGDVIQLRVKADSPIDVTRIRWTPDLFYTESSDVDTVIGPNGEYLLQLQTAYDVDIYPQRIPASAPQAWTAPYTGVVTATASLLAYEDAAGPVAFTVKRPGERLAKVTVDIVGIDPFPFPPEVRLITFPPVTFEVGEGDSLFFDFSSTDQRLVDRLSMPNVHVVTPQPVAPSPDETAVDEGDGLHAMFLPAIFHRLGHKGSEGILSTVPCALNYAAWPGSPNLFALPYRGWAYAGYNGSGDRASEAIREPDLVLPDSDYSLLNARAYVFYPSPSLHSWLGPDGGGGEEDLNGKSWVSGGLVSASRLGADHFDVPRPDGFLGMRAVPRMSRTWQVGAGGGASFLSGSLSTGGSDGLLDYRDMNGDVFPDIVGSGPIQYTRPTGGLEDGYYGGGSQLSVRAEDDFAWNVGIGGSSAEFQANGQGEVHASAGDSPSSNDTGSQMAELGFALNGGHSYSDETRALVDMNADGLPDRVSVAGSDLRVAFNLGYGFAGVETWSNAGIGLEHGSSRDFSVGPTLGGNDGIYGYAGGLSYGGQRSLVGRNWLDSQDGYALLDINGDGLPDWIQPDDGRLSVRLNVGNGFSSPVDWQGPVDAELVASTNTSLGGGLYFTVGIGPLCIAACYIIINPGGDGSTAIARQEVDLRDVDGDGYPDHIRSTDYSKMSVARNLTGRTNLLRTVQRPLGGSILLEYQREGNTLDMPESRWVLSRATVDDGQPGDGVDQQVTAFAYEGGVYSPLEREFYGFSQVVEAHLDDTGNPYRTITRSYHTDSYYTQGLLGEETTGDSQGRKYLETKYGYVLRDVGTGQELLDPLNNAATVFPELRQVQRRFYEGHTDPGKATSSTYQYDELGSLIRSVDLADVGSEDDVEVDISYFRDPNDPGLDRYIVWIADSTIVTAGGREMRRREATIAPSTGVVTEVRAYLADGSAAVTGIAHDEYGNVTLLTGPTNYRGQVYALEYAYDDQVHTHLSRIEDSFGYVSMAGYDLRFGEVEHLSDINGSATETSFDQFGRAVSVVGPHETATGLHTLRYAYHHNDSVPWALTQQIDVYRDATDPIETVIFMDGLRRTIQTKRDAAIHTSLSGQAQDGMIVSGATFFDFLGRPIRQHYPITETLGLQGVYNEGVDDVSPTLMVYDVLDRLTDQTLPDATRTQYTYDFAPDREGHNQFLTRETDANGVPKETYRDVRGLTTAVKEFNEGGSQIIWTSYEYTPLRGISRVVDDQGNITAIGYDNLGRRTSVDSPDAGLTETVYDLASNPIQRITANLRAHGQAISYDFDYQRLAGITYPDFPENNVAYTYGAPGAAYNRANRIVAVSDESGLETFRYGRLGEIIKSVKRVASDTEGSSTNSSEEYTTDYVYDTWNRLQQLTFPDGEILTNEYDSGGQLSSAWGTKGGWHYEYLDRMEYDKFEDPVLTDVGNQTRTTYGYNPLNRCLEIIRTGGVMDGDLFQDLRLSCDNVGSITAQANLAADLSASQIGGATEYSYQYDDLRRLVRAEGTFDYDPDKQHHYVMDLTYDTLHNITAKHQVHDLREPSDVLTPQHETSYAWQYAYDGPQPHAPAHIGERTFAYDANGNQAGWEHDENGTRRTIVWDEENRIQSISDDGHTIAYKYNHAGERVFKRGPQGETVYVNPYFSMRDREVGIKHVYAGGNRIVSKLMYQDKPDANPEGKVPQEKDLYFYHPDHLGTSMYVTDADGEIYEHLEYFAFGETFAEESSNIQRAPYLYAGKELDEEVELYYFGARYYDPKTSTWLSPDPILDRLLAVSVTGTPSIGRGSVYNSRTLQLYAYAEQSPLTYVDLDGQVPRWLRWLRSLPNRIRNRRAGGVAREAGGWQGSGAYPGVDRWRNTVLKAGTFVVAGIAQKQEGAKVKPLGPQGPFYAAHEGGQAIGSVQGNPDARQYNAAVQVGRHPSKGFRPFVAVFRVLRDVPVAEGVARANTDHGAGGAIQYYIPSYAAVLEGPIGIKQAY